MLVMKSGKRYMTKGIDLQNQVVITTLVGKENYKYLRILEVDTIKQAEMKGKIKTSIPEEPENYSRKKLDSKNPVKRINTGAVHI